MDMSRLAVSTVSGVDAEWEDLVAAVYLDREFLRKRRPGS
jgi:hypothetical protein